MFTKLLNKWLASIERKNRLFRNCVEKHLDAGNMSGQELRQRLRSDGIKRSGPSLYQKMAQLEDEQFVLGWDLTTKVDGYACKQRWYALSRNAWPRFNYELPKTDSL